MKAKARKVMILICILRVTFHFQFTANQVNQGFIALAAVQNPDVNPMERWCKFPFPPQGFAP